MQALLSFFNAMDKSRDSGTMLDVDTTEVEIIGGEQSIAVSSLDGLL